MRIKPADTTEWYKQDGDNTFRINYPQLTPRSIVVDLGARIGSWADIIEGNYACRVFCFEAVEQYCKVLLGKGYQVHQKAVTDKEGTVW